MARGKVPPDPQAGKKTHTRDLGSFAEELKTSVVVTLNRISDRPAELSNVAAGMQSTVDDVFGDSAPRDLLAAAAQLRAFAARAHGIVSDVASLAGVFEGLALAMETKNATEGT